MKKLCLLLLCFTVTVSYAQLDPEQIVREQEERKKAEDKKSTVYDSLPRDASGDIVYTDVVKLDDSISAQQLYSKAKLFIAENFKNAKSVTDFSDDEAKILIKKAVVPVLLKTFLGSNVVQYCSFTLKIECKDNRYRYTIDNIAYVGDGAYSPTPFTAKKPLAGNKKYWIDIQKQFHSNIIVLLFNMKLNLKDRPKDDF